MCGLVGIVGSVWKRERSVFDIMFFMNTLRGPHGCGLFTMGTSLKEKIDYWDVDKSELPSSSYIFTEEYDRFIDAYSQKVIMGHSRYATIGKITTDNNHPFSVYKGTNKKGKQRINLVGMHNGTIRGTFDGTDKFDTDSEALFNLISAKGDLKEALSDVYRRCHSIHYALAFYDFEDDSVNLIRNEHRPLYLCKWNDCYLWSSDSQFLRIAFSRCGIDSKEYGIYPIEPHTLVQLYPYKYGAQRIKVTKDFINPPKYDWKLGTFYRGNVNTNGQWSRDQKLFVDNTNKNKDTDVEPDEKDPSEKTYYKVNNRIMMPIEFLHFLNQGCACCGNPKEETDNVRFSSDGNEIYCEECKDILADDFNIKWDNLSEPVKETTKLN